MDSASLDQLPRLSISSGNMSKETRPAYYLRFSNVPCHTEPPIGNWWAHMYPTGTTRKELYEELSPSDVSSVARTTFCLDQSGHYDLLLAPDASMVPRY
ncbi:hypothetical protein V2G26_014362 [Clonostachys chloroleuca]